MTDLETAFYVHCQTKTSITALCGVRIFPDALPQGCTLPAVTYHEISVDSEEHLKNVSGLCHTRLQVQCYSATAAAARALREVIRLVWAVNRGSFGGLFVCGVQNSNKFGRYEPPIDGSNSGRYLRSIDLIISHHEEIPVRA